MATYESVRESVGVAGAVWTRVRVYTSHEAREEDSAVVREGYDMSRLLADPVEGRQGPFRLL